MKPILLQRDENFLAFVAAVVDKAFADQQDDLAALMAGELENAREKLVQKIGENIRVRRLVLIKAGGGETVGHYVHSNHRIAVLVTLKNGDESLAKDVAMHVAAINPQVARPEDMPKELVDKEKTLSKHNQIWKVNRITLLKK